MVEPLAHSSIDSPPVQSGRRPDEVIEQLEAHPETRGLATTYRLVTNLATACAERGGRLFIVGGAVRDEILGLVPRDFDLEVHGVTQDHMAEMARQLGDPKNVGQSFGTILLQTPEGKIDIALPRRDSKTGDGHRDFSIDIVPHLGLREAARRREFSLGAIYKDVLDGQIYDPHHGIADLESKTLRMVDPATFSDDALRILRGAGFVSRFDLTVDPATKRAMTGMVERLGFLKPDRIREEWLKLLIGAGRPSSGIGLLRDIGVLERWHPELAKLWSTPQDPDAHPEGDVGTHTMMVIDEASGLTLEDRAQRREIILAALCHDLGKPSTTTNEHGRLRAQGHEAAGGPPTEKLLKSIGISQADVSRVVPLVVNHRRPAELYRHRRSITDRALRKLTRDVGPNWIRALVIVAEADHRGRGPFIMDDGLEKTPDTTGFHDWWEEQIRRLQLDQIPEPILSGHDLISDRQGQGWRPGKLIGQAIQLGQELAINGMKREEILRLVDDAEDADTALSRLQKVVAEQEAGPEAPPDMDGKVVVERTAIANLS